MDKVILKRTGRIRAGHLWIFSNELAAGPKHFEPGALAGVYDTKGGFLGIGYVNPNSLISVRLLTREREEIDSGFFRRRIAAALSYRERFLPDTGSCRLVYSEGDFLPGLIVDKYSDCLVIQILTLGMERLRDTIMNVLDEMLSPSVMVLRNDSQSRVLEGLPLEKKVIKGTLDSPPVIKEGEVFMEVDPLSGQKTGFFLDQRENRIALSGLVDGGRCLDLFCYSGAWGLQLAGKGMHITFVDDSEAAIAKAGRNAGLNRLESACGFVKEDVFKFLKREAQSGNGNAYECVVLDPPAFVKSKAKIKEALRGYREINTLAMRLLRSGGILATSSCSYHVDRDAFLDMLRSAAMDAGRDPRLLEYRSQGKDHPILLSVPETEYLKCAFLEL
ncbi:MAG: class I SAM-dependent rRNA methyltransferase [Nitrospirae bacterium]|nr:class I SAM-dependent rRNA methyltransferase [Nitrospirota bacterium]MCL5237771.1 class I SAM-dependent rRNA methyltransferase [Nitrospirota bacterium]